MSADEDRLLPPREIAAILGGVHPDTVRRYADDGLLQSRRVSLRGHRRISEQSAHELAAVLAMDLGPDRDAALEALRRRNLGLPQAQPGAQAEATDPAEPSTEPGAGR
jgi:DNA-binding transcriptional MerR regulator